MNINNRDILLNIGAYAQTTQCAYAYGSVQSCPLVFTRGRTPVTSLCLKQQYTDIYAVLKSTRVQLSMIRCSAANRFFRYRASTSEKSGQAR